MKNSLSDSDQTVLKNMRRHHLAIAGDTYDLVVDDSKESKHDEINLFKSFFTRIDKESYDISVCQNKLVMDSQDSSTKIALNLAIKA